MARISEVYGGNYLKAEDIQGRGDVPAVIENISIADLGDGKKKAVLHFRGKDKTLALNVTNANMLEEIFGTDEMDDWVGQRIVLYTTKVDFQGKRVLAIRIKQATNGAARQATPPPPPEPVAELTDDDIPF